jgi:hypothetical protein
VKLFSVAAVCVFQWTPVSQRFTATHCRKHSACRFAELGPALSIRHRLPQKKAAGNNTTLATVRREAGEHA